MGIGWCCDVLASCGVGELVGVFGMGFFGRAAPVFPLPIALLFQVKHHFNFFNFCLPFFFAVLEQTSFF